MNDHDAMTAINAVLESFYRGQADAANALLQIALISGRNSIQHQEAAQQ